MLSGLVEAVGGAAADGLDKVVFLVAGAGLGADRPPGHRRSADAWLAMAGRYAARLRSRPRGAFDNSATIGFFDGGCPICSREIKFYQGREGSEAFDWIDVTRTDDGMLGPGLSRNAALARLHVRRADGKVVSGAAAFAEIWRGLPGLRWLGRLLAVPPFGAVAEFGYWLFLHLRKLRR